jgi:tripartite-type tricarboxylate transporter receptor subunit TctC
MSSSMICLRLLTVVITAAAAHTVHAAQKWPERPLRIVVPFVPGAGGDLTGRLVAKQLSDALGQQAVVDNRPGAGSIIGTEIVAKSAPDGYTLLIATAAYTYIPGMYSKLGYDSLRDLTGVSLVSTAPFLLVVRPNFPAQTVPDLVKMARAKPGEILYSSAGQATAVHLATALFAHATKTQLTQVPYKGGGQAVVALLGNEVALMFATPETLLAFVRDGRLRPVAVTSRERVAVLPAVPTMIENGLKDYEHTAWFGVIAPAGTPREIVGTVNRIITKGMTAPDMRERFAQQGSTIVAGTPEQFNRFIREEITRWTGIIKDAGIKLD